MRHASSQSRYSPRKPAFSLSAVSMFTLCSGLVGAMIAPLAGASPLPPISDRQLLAQQIVDGLPPPPPLIFGQQSLPNHQPTSPSGSLSQVPTADPAFPSQPTPSLEMNGTETLPPPDLLPTPPVPREVEFGQPGELAPATGTTPPSESASPGSAYFVVIPAKSSELTEITEQITRLGEGMQLQGMIQTATRPRGPHVRVGPFADRSDASRWSQYLRDFGMDARVYYQ